jgi:hypothetical protein
MYAYIIKGKLETIPFYVNLKASILLRLSFIEGIYDLSEKNTVAIAMLKYAEHKTPIKDENVKELAVLGIERGKRIKNDAPIPETSYPKSFFPIHDLIFSSEVYNSTIMGMAVLI